MMADSSRRIILRVAIKILSLISLIFIGVILFSGGDEPEEANQSSIPPLLIGLERLPLAQPRRIEWSGGPLQLLKMSDDSPLFVFYDRGGNLNCPLVWQPPGASQAPTTPWPGGFRDQCSSVWYLYSGQVLPAQSSDQNLQSPPYHFRNESLLQVGVNRDNTGPAN